MKKTVHMHSRIRRALALLSVLAILFSLGCLAASAETVTDDVIELPEGVYYLEDGSYFVTEKIDVPQTRASGTKTYGKTTTYYNNSNEAKCALEVLGTFTYNGSSVSCTNVTAKTYVYDTSWSVENVTKSSSSGWVTTASATANADFVNKVLFITVKKIPVSVTVTCDKNGN
ncbi:MAG TPA: hypothetical protein H9684_02020 [Firmicutes bacterium]|nr:hypothetical protein [Bacillota bacterium]